MKTKYFIFAASALVALASCSSDEYIGDNSPTLGQGDGSIQFGSGFKAVTRADKTGADAATLLNNKFIVGGFKGNGTTMTEVFDNYIVQWTANTAGKTADNTNDWQYVGITAASPSAVSGQQTIKYWDYSANQYDFVAYSLGTNTAITDGTPTTGQILVTEIAANTPYGPNYTLKGSAADLAKCYISDLETVTKASGNYSETVKLKFHSLGTQIRVGFYETIPGYSVKDVKFYNDNATTIDDGTEQTTATLFMPSGSVGFGSAGTYTVSFSADKKAHIGFAGDDATTEEQKKNFGTLNYTTAERNEAAGSYYLGRSSNAVTYAGATSPYYQTVMPTNAGAVIELRVDYTLVPIDGGTETIKIHGAKAFVPATYTAWQPNYAYTYIFKISDNTNGWTSTSESDPKGLFPITFDAVVTEATDFNAEQTTITTVATPSITTYQKGHTPSSNEYDKDQGAIYVQVMDNDANPAVLKTDLDTKGALYSLSSGTWTEADVMDALNVVETETATGYNITGRNGLSLKTETCDATITTIPGVDGNNISVTSHTAASFAPAVKTYAYVYYTGTDNADSYIYPAVELTSEPTDWNTGSDDLYYTDPAGAHAASTSYEDGTYYKKYTNLNKVYSVKIIKVVE